MVARVPRGYLGSFRFQPRPSLSRPNIKGNLRAEQRGCATWVDTPQTHRSSFPKHTHPSRLSPHPVCTRTSSCQKLQPLSPKHPRAPAGPGPGPARSLAPRPRRSEAAPQPDGVLQPPLPSSGPLPPGCADPPGPPPAHRLLSVHSDAAAADAVGARYPGSERNFRGRREQRSGRKPRP